MRNSFYKLKLAVALIVAALLFSLPSMSLADTPFYGEINMFAGNFAPRNWALCDGQLIAISQNSALFSLLGTVYGGDGRTTFALPDLRGRIAIGAGNGPGLSNWRLGQRGGAETSTLTANQLPSHNHQVQVYSTTANSSDVAAGVNWGSSPRVDRNTDFSSSGSVLLHTDALLPASGGGLAHENMPPSLAVNYIISLFGVFPSRN